MVSVQTVTLVQTAPSEDPSCESSAVSSESVGSEEAVQEAPTATMKARGKRQMRQRVRRMGHSDFV